MTRSVYKNEYLFENLQELRNYLFYIHYLATQMSKLFIQPLFHPMPLLTWIVWEAYGKPQNRNGIFWFEIITNDLYDELRNCYETYCRCYDRLFKIEWHNSWLVNCLGKYENVKRHKLGELPTKVVVKPHISLHMLSTNTGVRNEIWRELYENSKSDYLLWKQKYSNYLLQYSKQSHYDIHFPRTLTPLHSGSIKK